MRRWVAVVLATFGSSQVAWAAEEQPQSQDAPASNATPAAASTVSNAKEQSEDKGPQPQANSGEAAGDNDGDKANKLGGLPLADRIEALEQQAVAATDAEKKKLLVGLARAAKLAAFDAEKIRATAKEAQQALAGAAKDVESARAQCALALLRSPVEVPVAENENPCPSTAGTAVRAWQKAKRANEIAELAARHGGVALRNALAAEALTAAYHAALEASVNSTDQAEAQKHKKTSESIEEQIETTKLSAVDEWLLASKNLTIYKPVQQKAELLIEAQASESRTLANGARLSWGVTGALVRFQTQRSPRATGSNPTYHPRLEFVPGDVGFQFLSEPASAPWRLRLKDGGSVQLISWGGMLLLSLGDEDQPVGKGSLSLGATLAFFESIVGLGIGFDLYRGIPVQGGDGNPGTAVAYTGVLAWAFSQEGEVTAENAFAVVSINLSTLVDAITGEKEED